MIVIPAIDIIGGKVVRLYQGDFNKEKLYSEDPVKMALKWQNKGASFLHIVDLDGAKYGEIRNRDIITSIIKSVNMSCEVGGGLRSDKDVEYFLKQGASRVVIGTRAFEDLEFLKDMISRFNQRIVLGIDFSGEKIAKKGWTEATDLTPEAMLKKIKNIGVKTIVVTDITVDGTLKGPNIERLKKILNSVDISVIASGGVSNLEDIKRLKDIGSKNLEGVIVGRALYEGKVDLEEAIKIC
ncbi:MAG: 1-(5-phosphoribosyl)-5-[(5-phosphoribosylamino)methylideneamino]imidazole-4-carboxamide isomerase [Candidatus Gorgyraea atricola]|nr:1-(5-phosphoribosyl)-5-[(5-phosphoribosylamino)methylideneamino]imidazole-4-carboxamide isomerase [Candidatus Gorgyraea atricola]